MKKFLAFFWFFSLFLLPFDNFPFFASGFIKPLAVLPFFFLFFFFLIFVLAGKEKLRLNQIDIVFLIFIFLIFFNSSIQLLLLPSGPIKEITPFQRFFENFYFLSLIIMFYFCPRIILNSRDKIKKTFKTLILAFIFPVVWGVLQASYALSGASWSGSFFREIERVLVTKGGVFGSRISLLSAEPSWAATQLLLLLLPILFFCFYFKYSFFKKINLNFGKSNADKNLEKAAKINLETIFLFFALFCLIMTFSVTAFIAAVFSFLLYFCIFLRKKRFYKIVTKAIFLTILFLLIAFPFVLEFTRRVDISTSVLNYDLISILRKEESFLVRGAGWIVGLGEVFHSPLLGVGFRNTMFYYAKLAPKEFQENRAVRAYANPDYLSLVPTPKGFFPGIIGETGLVGFTLFLIFYLAILRKIAALKIKNSLTAVVKYSTLFSLFLAVPLGLSLDFTYPYFWLVFGIANSIEF